MCGIAGIASETGIGSDSQHLLKQMCDVIRHRGPDDEGFFFSDQIGIGMRRLSIIDLKTGQQPQFNEDKTVAVVLNGEIYNYRELRKELLEKGHTLNTTSDTETIVHLYEEYGDECVRHLRGMFCFALWDSKKQRLLLARDRAGIKQLYYSETGGRFTFGSEIKCILQSVNVTKINNASVLEYLTYLYTPAPNTIYNGIFELPPAHYLTWQAGDIELTKYWQLEYRPDEGHSEEYYVEGMLAHLTDAVRSHMIADVPVGAFLSGGIDSGIVVALMAQALGDPVETFTIGFDQDYGFYDERKEAAIVSTRYGTNHHALAIRPDVLGILPRIIGAFDQPHADSSSIPNYYVCELASRRVKVAVTGMGGDEIAGGYERYLGVLLGQRYRALPSGMRSAIAKAVLSFRDFGGTGRFSSARMKRFVSSAELDAPTAYLQLISTFNRSELEQLLIGEVKAELAHFTPEDQIHEHFSKATGDCINGMLNQDLNGYLPGDLLPLSDRLSMAHSLEVRVPMLDHQLLEYMATIPSDLKINGTVKKYILRKIGSKLLPKEIMNKPKRGFSVPMAFWLRGELRQIVEEHLSVKNIANVGFFNPVFVEKLKQDHFGSRANNENKIWALLMFMLWHETYIAKPLLQRSMAL